MAKLLPCFILAFFTTAAQGDELYDFLFKIENPRGAIDGVDDQFGVSLDQVGNHVVIGAYRDDTGAENSGVVHLFTRDGELLHTILNPTPEADDWFGFEVRAVEERIIVAARNDDTAGTNTGSVYLFDQNGVLLVTIANPNPSPDDGFGQRIAAIGDKIAVSAWNDDEMGSNAGVVYLFDQQGNLLQEFYSPSPHPNGRFGRSISAIGDDRIVIGTYRGSEAGDAGAGFLFDLDGNQLATFENPSPGEDDLFGGRLVGIEDEFVLFGAIEDSTSGVAAGTSYLFDLNGQLILTIPNPTPEHKDWFGRTHTGVSDGRFLIGAPFDDTLGFNAGAAYLYDLSGELLQTFLPPTPSESGHFSLDVTTLDELLLIGADFDGGRFMGPGAVYVYAPTEQLAGDYNGDGAVDQADLDLVLLNWGAGASTLPAGWTSNLPESRIDQNELDGVLLNWGETRAASLATSVPEPGSWRLVIMLVFALIATQGRAPVNASPLVYVRSES